MKDIPSLSFICLLIYHLSTTQEKEDDIIDSFLCISYVKDQTLQMPLYEQNKSCRSTSYYSKNIHTATCTKCNGVATVFRQKIEKCYFHFVICVVSTVWPSAEKIAAVGESFTVVNFSHKRLNWYDVVMHKQTCLPVMPPQAESFIIHNRIDCAQDIIL